MCCEQRSQSLQDASVTLRRTNLAPAVQEVVTWARYLGTENPRILNKKPRTADADRGVLFRSLAMTYSHMGKPHTTIGDDAFHY